MSTRPWTVDDDLVGLIEPLLPPWTEKATGSAAGGGPAVSAGDSVRPARKPRISRASQRSGARKICQRGAADLNESRGIHVGLGKKFDALQDRQQQIAHFLWADIHCQVAFLLRILHAGRQEVLYLLVRRTGASGYLRVLPVQFGGAASEEAAAPLGVIRVAVGSTVKKVAEALQPRARSGEYLPDAVELLVAVVVQGRRKS